MAQNLNCFINSDQTDPRLSQTFGNSSFSCFIREDEIGEIIGSKVLTVSSILIKQMSD